MELEINIFHYNFLVSFVLTGFDIKKYEYYYVHHAHYDATVELKNNIDSDL